MSPHLITTALVLSLGAAPATAYNTSLWPHVGVPPDASMYHADMGATFQGLPMRIQGFVSRSDVPTLATWFRHSLGQPLTEDRIGTKLLLGQARGEYFVSVQLEPIGDGSRAVLAVSHLKAGFDRRAENDNANARILARLPSGTRLISRLGSSTSGKNSSHLVFSNNHETQLNRDQLVRMLNDDGLRLERETNSGTDGAVRPTGQLAAAITMFFKGRSAEAMVVIARRLDGQTTIVLNRLTLMEHVE